MLAACAEPPTQAPAVPSEAPPTDAPTTAPTEAAMMEATTPASAPPTEMLEPTSMPTDAAPLLSGAFVNEEVPTSGTYSLDPATGVLRFSDDFATLPGPDLIVILSGASDLTLSYQAFSQMVVETPLLELGSLARRAGAQEYAVPPGTDLALYRTVVVWCQAFSVAFGAAPLNP
jgi:hypothetical protein